MCELNPDLALQSMYVVDNSLETGNMVVAPDALLMSIILRLLRCRTHAVILRDPTFGNDSRGFDHDSSPSAHRHRAEMHEMMICRFSIIR